MIEKLEVIFKNKYQELLTEERAKEDKYDTEFWVDYCDQHKIKIMHPEWVKESFNEDRADLLCIFSPENEWWLLVPKELAEKTLVLGYLP